MNYQTKRKLKIAGAILLGIVAIGAALFFFVPAAKKWMVEAWDKVKGVFSKKK